MHGAKCERFTYVSFKFPKNPGQILAEAYTNSARHYSNIRASLSLFLLNVHVANQYLEVER